MPVYGDNQWVTGWGDFPGSPVVKTSPSNAGVVDLIPGQGAKILHAGGQKTKMWNGNNIVTNSIPTLKIVHIKKKKKKKGLEKKERASQVTLVVKNLPAMQET